MSEITEERLAQIEARDKARTQGEWGWTGWVSAYDIRLHSYTSMRPIVMDFVRWGMQGAAPRFRDAARDIMERFKPVSPNHHYPNEIRAIDHPDAVFIAACSVDVPDMVAEIRRLQLQLAESQAVLECKTKALENIIHLDAGHLGDYAAVETITKIAREALATTSSAIKLD